jgi:type II secretory pathway component PulF
MSSFAYVARETGSGREIRSSVDANTEQAAIAALLNRNLLVVSIQEKVGKKGRTGGGKVGLADLVIFTRQLATMIDAGLAMVQSLQALAEHNYKHTSIIHSHDVEHMTAMARALDTTLFIKNGPCMAGLGLGGEGYLSYSIATPTGEGVTNPKTFCRVRRCVMVDNLRIY